MLFINFEKVSKDTKISGNFTSVKIIATLAKLKLLSYINDGHKPTIFRREQEFPNMRKGWFVKMGDGGKSGEPLIRLIGINLLVGGDTHHSMLIIGMVDLGYHKTGM